MNDITIYGDGSSRKNKDGGYGFIILEKGEPDRMGSGFEHNTTNNRQELNAVIYAIQACAVGPRTITVWSDSQYVIKAFTDGWLAKWKRNYWMNNGEPVKNKDLWVWLDSLVQSYELSGTKFAWEWCRGHDGNYYNEIVDKLAQAASLEAGNHP